MLDRAAATRWTRIAQGGAVGALALSAAAVMVTLPGQRAELPPAVAVIPVATVPGAGAAPTQTERPDGTSAGKRLGKISNKPTPAIVPEELPKGDDHPPPPPAADITYHGIVTIGPKAMGLIKHNTKQRFVKIGDKVGDEKVEEITPDHLRLGATHIINLAERAGDATARLRSTNPGLAQTIAPRPETDPAFIAAMIAAKKAKNTGTAPPYVPLEEVPMWRKMRAQLILSGQYAMQEELDEIAYKHMQENRDRLKADPVLTSEEQDAENAFNDKMGRGEGGKEKK